MSEVRIFENDRCVTLYSFSQDHLSAEEIGDVSIT